MPLKQYAFTKDRVINESDYMGIRTEDRPYWTKVLQQRAALHSMLDKLWGEREIVGDAATYGSNVRFSNLFRTEDGKPLPGQRMQVAASQGGDRNFRQATGTDAVFAYFQTNPNGRLQILDPETRKPHYLTLGQDGQGNACYNIGDPVPEKIAPPKPNLWDKFLNLFKTQEKVTNWNTYQAEKQERDSYVKFGTDILDKRERKQAARAEQERAEARIWQEKTGSQPEIAPKPVKEPIKEQVKESVKEQPARDNPLEDMAKRAEGAQMQQLARRAQEATKRLEGKQNNRFNSHLQEFHANGFGSVLDVATVLSFRLASKDPAIADRVNNSNMGSLVNQIAHSSSFLKVIDADGGGVVVKSDVYKDCVQNGGAKLEKDYLKELASSKEKEKEKPVQNKAKPVSKVKAEPEGPSAYY